MRFLCEVVAFDILPAARSLIAKKLMEKHGFSQKQVATSMGITQPAVSQYRTNSRGYRIELFLKSPQALAGLEDITKRLSQGMAFEQLESELYHICERLAHSMRSSGNSQP